MKVITIGRSTENNDIVVNDQKVSRNHLQMVMDDNGNYSVVDLGSTNGTYVNGQRISGEVRLQPSDEVRIGQTVLPWQNYFASIPQPPIINHPLSPRPPKPNRTWLYVIIGAALLLLIGGGVALKIHDDKQKAKIEQEEKDKAKEERQLLQEANDARVEAARLSEEAEIAARRAAESKSKEDQAKADAAARKAEEANRLAIQKENEWKKMKMELDEARAAQREAEEQNVIAQQAKAEAEQESRQAKEAARRAKEAQVYAETETRLIKEFYGLSPLMKSSDWKKICKDLKWTPMKGESEEKCVARRFDKGNNDQKQKIVNAMKKVKNQPVKEESNTESNQTNTNTEQPASATDDTIKQ